MADIETPKAKIAVIGLLFYLAYGNPQQNNHVLINIIWANVAGLI